jgi:transcriptional regulator with XRE-family HTH domain
MMRPVSLGDRIRAAREAAGLSQEELAQRTGVSQRTLGNWERGVSSPRSRLGSLERVLGVHLRDEDTDHGGVSLRNATDTEVVADLAHRLADRDRRIRELTEEVERLRTEVTDPDQLRNAKLSPPRWAARARDQESGGVAR